MEENTDKRLCDVEEPLEPHTQVKGVEIFRPNPRIPRLPNTFTGLCIVLFVCILLVRGCGPHHEDCAYGKCGPVPSALQSDNSTTRADALLLTKGNLELQHYEDPLWQQRQASQLASTWGFLSGQILFASVAGRMCRLTEA